MLTLIRAAPCFEESGRFSFLLRISRLSVCAPSSFFWELPGMNVDLKTTGNPVIEGMFPLFFANPLFWGVFVSKWLFFRIIVSPAQLPPCSIGRVLAL